MSGMVRREASGFALSALDGPQNKAPALAAAGMMGDRADVIFAEPQEISGFIAPKC